MKQRYRVTLDVQEREQLQHLLAKGKAAVRRLKHAQILLASDQASGRKAPSAKQIAQSLNCGQATVERVRRRFVEEGFDRALNPYRIPRSRQYPTKLDGKQEAQLIALACSEPPAGRSRWTLRLLADQMVALEYVDTLSYETVRQTLKKMNSNHT